VHKAWVLCGGAMIIIELQSLINNNYDFSIYLNSLVSDSLWFAISIVIFIIIIYIIYNKLFNKYNN
jgi:hypothetical protein